MISDDDGNCKENSLGFHKRCELIEMCELDSLHKLFLLIVNRHLGENSACWPGVKSLSQKCGKSERTIKRIIGDLKEIGVLNVKQRKHKSALLSINWNGFQEVPPVSPLDNQEVPNPASRSAKSGNQEVPNSVSALLTEMTKEMTKERTVVYVLKNGGEWILPEAKISEYEATYPKLDVMQQLQCARQWCTDNPGKRKTSSGMNKFLNGWLTRQINDQQQGKENGNRNSNRTDAGQVFDPSTREEEIVA